MKNKHENDAAFALIMELRESMAQEGVRDWLSGINDMLGDLSLETDEGFDNAKSTYKFMMTKMGTRGLSEFIIWRDDFETQKLLNERIVKILDELWKILGK